MIKKVLTAALGVMAGAAISVSAANAATIVINGGSAEIECTAPGISSPECQGVSGSPAGALGLTADAYGAPADPASMADFLNDLMGTSFTTGVRTDLGVADDIYDGEQDGDVLEFTFTTTAEYFALKMGNNVSFFKNLAGAVTLTVMFDRADGQAGRGFGLSNITEFGEAPVGEVPLPAAAWLMIAGLGGLGFAGRKKVA